MKRLFIAGALLTVFRCALTVHWCYVCEDSLCHNSPLENIRQNCRTVFNNKNQHYLCETRENKTADTIVKRCILNNAAAISECNDLNLDKQTACYHCDRELCNTRTTTVEEYLAELKSLDKKYKNK